MGGHVYMSRYSPHKTAKKVAWTTVLGDVRDVWAAIDELLESDAGKAEIAKAVKAYPAERARKLEASKVAEAKRKKADEQKELKQLKAEEAALAKEEVELDAELNSEEA